MNITFPKFNIHDDVHTHALIKWKEDPAIGYLITPKRKPDPLAVAPATQEKLKQDDSYNYMIFDQAKPIGTFSIHIDPPHLMKKIKGTSWLGLTIGEKEYWGKGVAKFAMDYFEQESIKLGAKRVELGTFEFNVRAQAFYKKLGFIEFARISNFTYWQDRYWDDVRMEKKLF